MFGNYQRIKYFDGLNYSPNLSCSQGSCFFYLKGNKQCPINLKIAAGIPHLTNLLISKQKSKIITLPEHLPMMAADLKMVTQPRQDHRNKLNES